MKKKAKKSEDEPDFEKVSKSITENMEEDEGARQVLDAVPFMKALVDRIEDQFTEMIKAIVDMGDRIETIESGMTGLEKSKAVTTASAKLLKSIRADLKAIGDTPQPRKSVLSDKLVILNKSGNGDQKNVSPLTKSQALDKVGVLFRNNKIDLKTATVAESRIQQGFPLQPEVEALLTANG